MNSLLDDLKKKLGEEFLEKKENRVKKPRQARTGLTQGQQRAQARLFGRHITGHLIHLSAEYLSQSHFFPAPVEHLSSLQPFSS